MRILQESSDGLVNEQEGERGCLRTKNWQERSRDRSTELLGGGGAADSRVANQIQ